jgi:hypothetical protein
VAIEDVVDALDRERAVRPCEDGLGGAPQAALAEPGEDTATQVGGEDGIEGAIADERDSGCNEGLNPRGK